MTSTAVPFRFDYIVTLSCKQRGTRHCSSTFWRSLGPVFTDLWSESSSGDQWSVITHWNTIRDNYYNHAVNNNLTFRSWCASFSRVGFLFKAVFLKDNRIEIKPNGCGPLIPNPRKHARYLLFSFVNHMQPNQDFNIAIKINRKCNLMPWYSERLEWIILDYVHWPDLLTNCLLLSKSDS